MTAFPSGIHASWEYHFGGLFAAHCGFWSLVGQAYPERHSGNVTAGGMWGSANTNRVTRERSNWTWALPRR